MGKVKIETTTITSSGVEMVIADSPVRDTANIWIECRVRALIAHKRALATTQVEALRIVRDAINEQIVAIGTDRSP